jgi:hypothetical protein
VLRELGAPGQSLDHFRGQAGGSKENSMDSKPVLSCEADGKDERSRVKKLGNTMSEFTVYQNRLREDCLAAAGQT